MRAIAHEEEKSPRCMQFVDSLPPLSAETVAHLGQEDAAAARLLRRQGRTRYADDLPVWFAEGPLTRQAYELGVEWDKRLCTATNRAYV